MHLLLCSLRYRMRSNYRDKRGKYIYLELHAIFYSFESLCAKPLLSIRTRKSWLISETFVTPARPMQSLISSARSFRQSSTPA